MATIRSPKLKEFIAEQQVKALNASTALLSLHSGQPAELSQKFKAGKITGGLNVELVYKASPDFKLNDEATSFTKGITWQAGSTWYWSALVFPKVDLSVRLDKHDGHCYKLLSAAPGGNWQTAKFQWENILEKQEVAMVIVAPPGHGSLWINSVSVPE